VTDDQIYHIEFALRYWNVLKENLPYIISIYDLDVISEISERNEFISFVLERLKIAGKDIVFAVDEIDYLLLYREFGFEEVAKKYAETKISTMYIGHLEQHYPDFYKNHFLTFLDDPMIANSVASGEIDTSSWS
jgi:hypothetical protein